MALAGISWLISESNLLPSAQTDNESYSQNKANDAPFTGPSNTAALNADPPDADGESSDREWEMLQPPDREIERQLDDWLQNEYIENISRPDYHFRSRLVAINSKEVLERANASFVGTANLPDDTPHPSDLLLTPFSDKAFRVRVKSFYVGRDGTTVISGRVLSLSDGEIGKTYLTISANGTIRGRVETDSNYLRVRPTASITTGVVSDFDAQGIRSSIQVD